MDSVYFIENQADWMAEKIEYAFNGDRIDECLFADREITSHL